MMLPGGAWRWPGLSLALAAVALSGSACAGDSSLGDADWVCPAVIRTATNVTAEFRTTFPCPSGTAAELAIGADTTYSVFLNGKTVMETGHLPDTPGCRYYDVLSLKDLRPEGNELLIRLYSQGMDSFQYMGGDPGFAFAVRGESLVRTSAGPIEWRLSTADRAAGVPIMTGQLGFSYVWDGAAEPDAWKPVAAADRVRKAAGMPFVRRPVPPPRTVPALPSRIVGQGVLDGSPAPDDISTGMDATEMKARSSAAMLTGTELPSTDGIRVSSDAFGEGFYVIVDLGREECGLLDLEFDTDAGTVVDIGHGEHIASGRVRTRLYSYRFAGRLLARAGRQEYCRWQKRMAGRYLQLHVRGAKTRFVLHRATLRPVLRDVREAPVPKALDARRAAIWRTAVRTLRLCMHEHYEDCPWREQALYANDARNQILCGRHAFDENGDFAALSLELLARGLRSDGWLGMCMPARIEFTIPSFTFSWNLALADHFRLYGDREFAARMMPVARRILDRRLSELKEGLLPCPEGEKEYWPFYDWAPGLDGCPRLPAGKLRFDAPLNLLLIQSLDADAGLAETLGDRATARRWREAAAGLRTRVRERFWNGRAQRLETYLGEGAGTGRAHELVQALAILADVVPGDALESVARKLSGRSDWVETTLSQSLHKYEALCKVGPEYGRLALRAMDAQWGRMLDAGATSFWEMKDGWKDFDGAGSLCHGWSAVPVHFYATHLELLTAGGRF